MTNRCDETYREIQFPIEPSDEELLNYYSRAVTKYVDEHGVEREKAMVYGLKEILKRWGIGK